MFILKDISDRLKNDVEIVIQAVSSNGNNLEYASDELKNNKDFVLAAMKHLAEAYLYASKELRNHKEITLIAFKQAGEYMLRDLFEENEALLTDDKFILDTLSENPYIINFLNDNQKKTKNYK